MAQCPYSIGLILYRRRLSTSAESESSERLEEMGHELRRPEADLLRDGIYELRVGLQHVNYRMLYFFDGQTAAVVSHGLVKEAEVPLKEINKAIERKRQFKKDPKAHTHEE